MALDYDNVDLTGISFSPDVPMPSDERRGDRRHLSMYRSAALTMAGFQGLCLIRNISAGGMMGKIHTKLPIGAPVCVELRSGYAVPGRIVWTADSMIGIQFDERIDVLQILHAPSEEDAAGMPRRMPRLNIPCVADLLLDNIHYKVNVIDVSQGGAKIESKFLKEGDDVIITIDDLVPQRSSIVWSHDGRAGVSFFQLLPFDTLAEWAIRRQPSYS